MLIIVAVAIGVSVGVIGTLAIGAYYFKDFRVFPA